MSDIPTGNSGQARKYTPGFGLEGVDYRLLSVEGGKMAVPVGSTPRPESPETMEPYGVRGVDFELERVGDGLLRLVQLKTCTTERGILPGVELGQQSIEL